MVHFRIFNLMWELAYNFYHFNSTFYQNFSQIYYFIFYHDLIIQLPRNNLNFWEVLVNFRFLNMIFKIILQEDCSYFNILGMLFMIITKMGVNVIENQNIYSQIFVDRVRFYIHYHLFALQTFKFEQHWQSYFGFFCQYFKNHG